MKNVTWVPWPRSRRLNEGERLIRVAMELLVQKHMATRKARPDSKAPFAAWPWHPLRIFVFLFCLAPLALADEPRQNLLKHVGIDQRLNAQVPPDLIFHDETGRDVRLEGYFGRRPMILALVYYGCPQLCTTVLNELSVSLNVLPTTVGKDFDILTISFDPHETSELASRKKAEYMRVYRRAGAQAGWHFLTGDPASIDALTRSVGFRYLPDPQFPGQFIHAGGLIILTPSGKVSRYFFGINYAPKDLRLSLADASEEKAGSLSNAILLFCFHYDPHTGRYTLAVLNLIKAAAGLTLITLGFFFVRSFRHDRSAALPDKKFESKPS